MNKQVVKEVRYSTGLGLGTIVAGVISWMTNHSVA